MEPTNHMPITSEFLFDSLSRVAAQVEIGLKHTTESHRVNAKIAPTLVEYNMLLLEEMRLSLHVKPGLHEAICLSDSFVFRLGHCLKR